MEVHVNYLAVSLAMISSMIVGSIWYAQGVFGKPWAKWARIDIKKAAQGNVWKPILVTMIVSLITAYVLAHVAYLSQHFFHYSFMKSALTSAFWLWLGFTATRFITHDAFEGRPAALTILNISHEFVTIMLMGLIIGAFGV